MYGFVHRYSIACLLLLSAKPGSSRSTPGVGHLMSLPFLLLSPILYCFVFVRGGVQCEF